MTLYRTKVALVAALAPACGVVAALAWTAPAGGQAARPGSKAATKKATPKAAAPAAGPEVVARGKKAYDAAGCANCHAIGGKGGSSGPDLTSTGAAAGRDAKWFAVQVTNPKAHSSGSSMPSFADSVKGADLTALATYLTTLKGASAAAPVRPVKAVPPPNPAVVAKIEQLGGSVMPLAQSDPRLEVDFHMQGPSVTDAALTPVASLKGVARLHLGRTSVTDAGLAHLRGLSDLEELHLEGTKITDRGLAALAGLKSLVYLNLYNTQVTDAGLEHLAGLSNLKRLFVWQTRVTDAGVARLKQALPQVEIVQGWDQAPKGEAPKAEEPKK